MFNDNSFRGVFSLVLFLLVFLFTSCGGSSDGNSVLNPDPSQPFEHTDPGPAYTGSTTQAVITAENTEKIVMESFGGGSIAATINSVSLKTKNNTTEVVQLLPVQAYLQILKQSFRRMGVSKKAVSTESTGRNINYQIDGESGGVVTFSMIMDDTTGSFSGSASYMEYSYGGVIYNGITQLKGDYDVHLHQLIRLSLSFSSLELTLEETGYTLTGVLSWGFSMDPAIETLSMNMVMSDTETSKTYWYNNYETRTEFAGEYFNQTISGRYYSHDTGYVDIVTSTPVHIIYDNNWPSDGLLRFSANDGAYILLTFLEDSLQITADFDNDGATDHRIERATNTLPPPANLPPVADAGIDQNVSQWSTVQLDGSGSSDPEEDALDYRWRVILRPDNSAYPRLTGYTSETPSFIADYPGTFEFSLRVCDGWSCQEDTVTVVVSPVEQTGPDSVTQGKRFGIIGTNVGQSGLLTTDLDGDGKHEIISSATSYNWGSNDHFYVVRENGLGDYEQIWRSPIYQVSIRRIFLSDINNDFRDDIFAVLTDGSVRVYDGPTLTEIREFFFETSLKDLAVGDLDGDGAKEIITTNGIDISIYSFETGEECQKFNTVGGTSISVGNVDSDSLPEIVTSSSEKGYVVNSSSGDVKWEYINGFGSNIHLTDVDSDGIKEIIGLSISYNITIYDAVQKSPVWEYTSSWDQINSMTIADADGDETPDILYGCSGIGDFHAINISTREEIWAVDKPAHNRTGIALADVDNDGNPEFIYGSSASLTIADPLTDTIEQEKKSISGISGQILGDIGDDDQDEIAFNYGGVQFFDAITFSKKTQVLSNPEGSYFNIKGIGDVDGDGNSELIVSSSYSTSTGSISAFDSSTFMLKAMSNEFDGKYFSTIAIYDVDNDGRIEIVGGQGGYHSGAEGNYLIIFDGETLEEKWRSDLNLSSSARFNNIKIADLDNNGNPDIIANVYESRLLIYDGVTQALKLDLSTAVKAFDVHDIDADGFPEILVGHKDGIIDVYDGMTFSIKDTIFIYTYASINALKVTDLDGTGLPEVIVADDEGFLSVLQGRGHSLMWRSKYLGESLALRKEIIVKDSDLNGNPDIFVSSYSDLYRFEFHRAE